jgi:predicted PurR-regulated permease PerM
VEDYMPDQPPVTDDVALSRTVVRLEPRNVARVTAAVLGVFVVAAFLTFVVRDGGSIIFTVLMAWFISIAMEPAVVLLARHMRRGAATGLVMAAFALFAVVFAITFGQLLVEQVAALLKDLPDVVKHVVDALNARLGTSYSLQDILNNLNITPEQVNQYAVQVLGGVLGLLGSVAGGIFSLFTLGLLTFYLSADGPRLRRWVAQLFSAPAQGVWLTVWDTTAAKTGGYVGARVVLAFINGASSALVFYLIGMPSWLALGIWTGVVAQFVPTIGTYIAIALPVIVGLLSDRPAIGIVALVWAVLYQQVENLTLEPRISARATDVHPAVAFASVLLGAALFGAAGAVLAVPVVAMLLSLVHIYVRRHDLLPSDLDDGRGDGVPADVRAETTAGSGGGRAEGDGQVADLLPTTSTP